MTVTAVLVPKRSWRPLLCFEFSEYDALALAAVEEYGQRIGAEYHLTLCAREAIPGWAHEHLRRRGLRRWWVRWEWNRMTRDEGNK